MTSTPYRRECESWKFHGNLIHSSSHVSKTLRMMLKNVQADGEMDEDMLEELVRN
jgi:hypothetical protein